MRLFELFAITENSDELYHVTHTKYVSAIQQNGLRPMGSASNWVQQGSGERYGMGEIYVFTNREDAKKWAARMDWEFNQTIGSGNISIITLSRPAKHEFEKDEADPMSQAGQKGEQLKTHMPISSENITGVQVFKSMKEAGAFKRQSVDHSLPYDDHEDEELVASWDERKTVDELWRGPHEGRYLQLFLAGKKPAILLMDYEMGPFNKYVESGELNKIEIDVFADKKSFVLTTPSQEWRGQKLKKLFAKAIAAGDEWFDKNGRLWHTKVGILLGYSNDDIRRFINSEHPVLQ